MGNYVMLGVATLFACLALLFVALSFATDHWTDTTVDREELGVIAQQGAPNANAINNSLSLDGAYFSRHRGLFRTCYDGTETFFLDLVDEDDITDGNCVIERGYEIDGEDQRVTNNEDYDVRIHLMRTHVAFYIVAIILLIVAVICGAIGCWKYSTMLCRVAAICSIAAVLFTAGGIAFFHGYEYLETEKINEPGFPHYELQQTVLDENTKTDYGYSYILGWLGVGMAVIAGILYTCAAWSIRSEKREKDQPFDGPQYNQFQPQPQPQPYMTQPQPYMTQPQPMIMTPPPQQIVTPAPSMYGGYGPTQAPVGYPMYQGYGY